MGMPPAMSAQDPTNQIPPLQEPPLDEAPPEAGEQIPADLTKAEASEHIDRLQAATGRDQQGRQQP